MADKQSKYALKRGNRFMYSKLLMDWIAAAKAGRNTRELSAQHSEAHGFRRVKFPWSGDQTYYAPNSTTEKSSYHSRLPRRGRHILAEA